MAMTRENKCCKETRSVVLKMEEYEEELDQPLHCITDHPRFPSVCPDRYVLETAYYQYRQHNTEANVDDDNKRVMNMYRSFFFHSFLMIGLSYLIYKMGGSCISKTIKSNHFIRILGQKSNGLLQTMVCKMPPMRPIFINRISHSSAASAR